MDLKNTLDRRVDEIADRLIAVRRHLHSHPEPSGAEVETTRYLDGLCTEAGLKTWVAPSGRGLIAERADADDAPRIGLRADIDALRLQDEKEVEYRSAVEGLTHACGHDAHAAMVLGAAWALQRAHADLPWPVPWRAVFQPAEESSEGAKEMIAAGAVENVRSIVAIHVDPERRVGGVGFRAGTLTAFCNEIDVVVRGRGGHAARPHHSVDPIAAACQFASSVYQFVPRSLDSRDPAVVTFGSIHGGFTQNVIPEEVRLRGTSRTHSHAATSKVEERILEIAHGVAAASGTEIEVSFKRGPDAVINDPAVTAACMQATGELLGAAAIESIALPSMGGEDFSEYLARVPGCLFRLGVAGDGETSHFLHSPRFDIDERSLAIGAKLLARCAVRLAGMES